MLKYEDIEFRRLYSAELNSNKRIEVETLPPNQKQTSFDGERNQLEVVNKEETNSFLQSEEPMEADLYLVELLQKLNLPEE